MPNFDNNRFKSSAVSRFQREPLPAGSNRENFNTCFGQRSASASARRSTRGASARCVDPAAIKGAIIQNHGNPEPVCADGVAVAIGEAFNKALIPWLGGNLLHGAMGSGPIPTFAPPYVPVGPVVGGMALHLAPGNTR